MKSKNGNLEKWIMGDVGKILTKETFENAGNVFSYLKSIKQTEENDICEPLFRYSLIIQFQYLLIRSIYGISKKDPEQVASAFETFNNIYEKMTADYETFFGAPFDPSWNGSIQNVLKKLSRDKQKFHDFEKLDKMYRLKKLFSTKEDVTMGLILNFCKEDLNNDGYYVEGGGNRLKILEKFCEKPG